MFENRREQEQGNTNETGLKEGGVIEIKTTVLFSLRDARSILFDLLTINLFLCYNRCHVIRRQQFGNFSHHGFNNKHSSRWH